MSCQRLNEAGCVKASGRARAISVKNILLNRPEEVPPVELIGVSCWPADGKRKIPCLHRLRRLNAASRRVPKIDSMLSSTGRTKQAESWLSGVPAFIKVGELGRKSSADSI